MSKNQLSLDYKEWLTNLKTKFQQTQIKASIAVNSSLLEFYWELGAEMYPSEELHS